MADPMPPEERDAMAAELALGLLDGAERATALRLSLAEPDFAAAVERWSLRLAPMLDACPAATPPAHLWTAIEARVAGGGGNGIVRRLHVWRGAAIAASGIAAALALVLAITPRLLPPPPPSAIPTPAAPSPVAVAQLAGPDGAATLAVTYDPGSGLLRLNRPSLAADGKSPELWVIPADGKPRSLGLIPQGAAPMTVTLELRPLLRDGATLAVSLEDSATAPHIAPTSTPILFGKISAI